MRVGDGRDHKYIRLTCATSGVAYVKQGVDPFKVASIFLGTNDLVLKWTKYFAGTGYFLCYGDKSTLKPEWTKFLQKCGTRASNASPVVDGDAEKHADQFELLFRLQRVAVEPQRARLLIVFEHGVLWVQQLPQHHLPRPNPQRASSNFINSPTVLGKQTAWYPWY